MTISDGSCQLAQLMAQRRTRRFARGVTMPLNGPLGYESQAQAVPLDADHEAALAFAAVGMTGSVLAELPFQADEVGGGNIMANLLGRTAVSPDAAHPTGVFVINDTATYYLKRPQDLSFNEANELIGHLKTLIEARHAEPACDALLEMYFKLRVELVRPDGKRPMVPETPPHTPIFNRWASNKPGTTFFLPVMELTEQYLCALFGGLDEAAGYYLLDDRNGLQPSGLRTYAKSAGGYLRDNDPKPDRVFVQDYLDTLVPMFASVELGAIMQNMSLMANALGVGGWPHWAAGNKWLEALGFEHKDIKASKLLGLPDELALALRATGNDEDVWSPLGLRGAEIARNLVEIPKYWDADNLKHEKWLIKPYCPPNYPDMAKAVEAFVEAKYGPSGRFTANGQKSRWAQELEVKRDIPRYSQRQIEAAIDHAEYIHERYGRFPAKFGPLVTLTAFQAHQIDEAFYQKYYQEDDRYYAESDRKP